MCEAMPCAKSVYYSKVFTPKTVSQIKKCCFFLVTPNCSGRPTCVFNGIFNKFKFSCILWKRWTKITG